MLKTIELNPSDAEAYYTRGFAYINKGQFDQACSDLIKAHELGNCQILERAKDQKLCK